MRIVFVTPEFVTEDNYDGGLANYLYRISLSLLQLGHRPIVVVVSNQNCSFTFDGIEVHRVFCKNIFASLINRCTRGKFSNTINWLLQSWSLNNAIQKINKTKCVDLIQYASYTAPGFFRNKKIPSVIRISSYQRLWREAYGNLNPTRDQKFSELLEILALKKADSIFGPSRVIANVLENEVGKNIEIIETPFILDTIAIDDYPFRDLLKGKKYLLFFGTIGLLKGAETIANCIEKLLKDHPEIYFVFVGKDAGYNGRPMMDYIWEKSDSFRGRVLYLGKMKHKHLYPIIKNAFAVVLPSRIDNFPNTCIEAMAHGKIVIGTKGTSFEQLVEDGKSGFLCTADNPDNLLIKIEQVINLNDFQRDIIANEAKARILELAPGNVVKKLIVYYNQVINKFKG